MHKIDRDGIGFGLTLKTFENKNYYLIKFRFFHIYIEITTLILDILNEKEIFLKIVKDLKMK